MKQPQMFVKLGPDKYIPVEHPWPDYDLYIWDEELQRIILKKKVHLQ